MKLPLILSVAVAMFATLLVDDASAQCRLRRKANCQPVCSQPCPTVATCGVSNCCPQVCAPSPVVYGSCSADVDVRFGNGGIIATGNVNCGVKCDINVTLTIQNPTAEFECTAGIVRTIVRLELEGDCVVVKGKACGKTCNFGGCSWNCSGWNNLGRFCP